MGESAPATAIHGVPEAAFGPADAGTYDGNLGDLLRGRDLTAEEEDVLVRCLKRWPYVEVKSSAGRWAGATARVYERGA